MLPVLPPARLTAVVINVPVSKRKAYPLVVAKLAVVALTALATSVAVLKVKAKPLVVAKPTCILAVLVAYTLPTKLVAVTVPPTYTPPLTPTPPDTVSAPVAVLVLPVALVMFMALVVVCPRSVTVCKLLVFHTVIVPVLLLTTVSVPAVSVNTPKFVTVKLTFVPVDTSPLIPI